MIIFLIMPIKELLRAFLTGGFSTFLLSLLIALGFLLVNIKTSLLQTSQEFFITIFLIVLHTACTLIFFVWDPLASENGYSAYYSASLSSLFEASIISRIPTFQYRNIFRITIVLLRLVLVPAVDKSVIPVQFFCYAFSAYLDYDREKHDQKLFESSFYSKQQLNKFKDLVVNGIPEGVVILSQDLTKCLFANNPFIELVGQIPPPNNFSTILTKFTIYEIPNSNSGIKTEHSLPSSKDLKPHLLTFLRTQNDQFMTQKLTCNLRYRKKEDHSQLSERIFEAKIIPLVWDEQPATGLILHDITQQSAIIRLKIAANLQKDRMLATVSHELRTPLNSILGMIQIAQQKVKDADILQYLSICSNSGNLLLGLVNSILDLNLIRANKLKLYTERINLNKFLQEILQLFEYQCNVKSIFLQLKISSFVPQFVVTDKNRLSQILINLIGNALKFTSEGGITVSVQMGKKNRDFIELSVQDTGVGIKEEEQGKLFHIFGKLETEDEETGTAVNTQGIGLGLTISNNLAKLLCTDVNLQGIKLQSEYGAGTKFSFLINKELEIGFCLVKKQHQEILCEDVPSCDLLTEGASSHDEGINLKKFYSLSPLKKPHTTQRSNPACSEVIPVKTNSQSTAELSPPRKKPYVLIVDDNPLNIVVVELFVQKHQYQVKTALSGQAAIDIMLKNNHNESPIKVIMMDLQMPIMDGYQATKILKELMHKGDIPETPIIALTANDNEDDRKVCKESGIADYLTKPIKEKDILQILEK